MEGRVLRWGVIGCESFSHDLVTAINHLDDKHQQKVVAVTGRDEREARQFASQHSIERVYCDQQSLIADDSLDLVFVGCLASLRYRVVHELLGVGRAVVCQSPLGVTARQCRQLVKQARAARVLLIEAAASLCSSGCRWLFQHLDAIGDIRALGCTLSCRDSSLSAGEQLLQLLCPAVQLVCAVMQQSKLLSAESRYQLSAVGQVADSCDVAGQDVSVCINCAGCVVSIVASSSCILPADAFIAATRDTIKLNGVFDSGGPSVSVLSYDNCHQMSPSVSPLHSLVGHVAACLRKGEGESSLFPLSNSMLCADMLERIRKQLGVAFAQDSFHCCDEQFHFEGALQ